MTLTGDASTPRSTAISRPTITTTGTVRQLGGLAASDYGRPDDRPPILLLHGLTFDRTIWSALVADLHRLDEHRRVIAVDLPGHGRSPDQASYRLDDIADRVHRVVTDADLGAPVLVGHSAGAIAATMYAARYPTQGVINVDQPLQTASFAELVRSIAPRLRGPEFGQVWQMFYASFHTELLPQAAQELVRATCRPRQEVVLGYWDQIIARPVDELVSLIDETLTALRQRGVRYLQIAGEDPGPDYQKWLAARLPAAVVDVWPQSGHFPHLAHPDRFVRRLAATAQPPG
jgi:pimeloyl-ACP methyl ester carboxylesterase